MYTTVFLPPLGHAVTILLTWAQHEQLKQLRLESIVCVAEIVKPQCRGKISPSFNESGSIWYLGNKNRSLKELGGIGLYYKLPFTVTALNVHLLKIIDN